MMIPIALVVGIAVLLMSVWLRSGSGHSRWWIGGNGIVDEDFAFATLPGLAGILIGAALWAFGEYIPKSSFLHGIVLVIGIIILAIGLVLSVLGFLRHNLPSWVLPRWYRDLKKSR